MVSQAYDDAFYSDRRYSMNSAKVIVPLILDLMDVKSVVDVGCGMGEFLHVFSQMGTKEILGIDGEWIRHEKLQIPEEYFLSKDLEKPLHLDRKFDLAISLEVAEHLNESSAKGFIDSLTNLIYPIPQILSFSGTVLLANFMCQFFINLVQCMFNRAQIFGI